MGALARGPRRQAVLRECVIRHDQAKRNARAQFTTDLVEMNSDDIARPEGKYPPPMANSVLPCSDAAKNIPVSIRAHD